MDDLRYALRSAGRTPIATCVIVASLALGIGANTAVFSFVDAVQFKPLPFHEEDTLVDVHEWSATELCPGCAVGSSYPGFLEWASSATSFAAIGAYAEIRVAVSGETDPERVGGASISAGLFPMLGVRPSHGREFTPADEASGAQPVALISDALWTRRFNGDAGVLGRTIRVNGRARLIVGVMPRGSRFPELADLWIPLAQEARDWPRDDRSLAVVARLRDGVSIDQARAEVRTFAAALEQTHPATNARWTADASALRDDMTEETATASVVLMSAVAFVLLIACANVAHLLLVRATERRREIALRRALGASRVRVIRMIVVESLMLSGAGGAAGLLLAMWGSQGIVAALATESPYWIRFGVDGRVVAFSIALTSVTGLLCGLWPAVRASREDPQVALKDGANASGGRPGRRAQHTLAVAQLALSLVLLAGAGLLLKSVAGTFSFDPGYDASRVVVGDVELSSPRYTNPARVRAFARDVVERLERIAGVRAAVSRTVFIAGFGGTRRVIEVEGLASVASGASPSFYAAVSPGYFRTFGVPILEGRDFSSLQDLDAVVINETLARRLWQPGPAIGHRIRLEQGARWLSVIGVVRDFGDGPLGGGHSPFAYVPFDAAPGIDISIVASSPGNGFPLSSEVRAAVRGTDSDQPVEDLKTAERTFADWASPGRFMALLMGALAGVALALAAIGTYGVIAYGVSQRTRELAIRVALGATSSDITRLVAGASLRLGMTALAIGIPGAWATTRALKGVLFGTSPTDPLVFTIATLILLCVSVLAGWLPARNASRVDPARALRT